MSSKERNLILIVFIIAIFFLISPFNIQVKADWWNTSFQKCQNITISSPLDDYQYKLILNTTNFNYSYANDDGSDIRIVNSSCNNGGVEVPYWIEEWNESGDSTLWFRGDNSSTTTYAVYYNYTDAENKSDGFETFLFFDDFNDDSLDTDKWTVDENTSGVGIARINNQRLELRTKEKSRAVSLNGTYFNVTLTNEMGAMLEFRVWTRDDNDGNCRVPNPMGYIVDNESFDWVTLQHAGWTGNVKVYDSLGANTLLGDTYGQTDVVIADCQIKIDTDDYYSEWDEIYTDPGPLHYFNGTNYTSLFSTTEKIFVKLRLTVGGSTEGCWQSVYFDNVRVRKFNETEPTTSIGSQENLVTEGHAKSTQITPNQYFLKWKTFQVSDDTTPDGTDISYKILKASDGSTLCSISSSQAQSGYDISSCAGQNSIKLYTNLSTTNTSNTPFLHEWDVSWLEQIGNITYELSADGGAHWELVSKGNEHTFTYPGDSLKVRINLTTFDTAYTPSVENYTINYTFRPNSLVNNLNYSLSSNSNANDSENWVCTQDLENNNFIAWVFNGTTPSDTSYSESGNNYGISMISPENILLAFSKGDCSKVKGRESAIKSGSFWNSIFPAFSYETLNYVVNLILEYTNINIVNNLRIGEGSYTLIIKNTGEENHISNVTISKL